MVFSAPRTDDDIKDQIRRNVCVIDPTPPAKIEREAWNMRPREKKKEIGPQFRFNYRVQL